MKKILYFSLFVTLIFSACRKSTVDSDNNSTLNLSYISTVQKFLRAHTDTTTYYQIDFNRLQLSKQKTHWYIQLGLINTSFATDFVLLQTDSTGIVHDARIIHLEKTIASNTVNDKPSYNGFIDISSLDKKSIVHSRISKGFIEVWHPQLFSRDTNTLNNTKEESFPVPYPDDELPEVIVVAYIPSATSDKGLSWSDYMMLENMFGGGGTGSSGSGGSGTDGNGSNGNSTDDYGVYTPINNTSSNPDHPDPGMVNFDVSASRPAIDLNAWMKCFTDIPDAGANCSVTLLGDLPVDGHPELGLDIFTGNTGHCFLQLTKTNGTQSVTQIIGFTAQSAGKAVLMPYNYIPSKIVDNAGHKYNCSITMPLHAAGLNIVINQIKSLSDMPYSIVQYDCLDFGLAVINAVRPNDPLVISKVADPNDAFSDIATGPKLYTLLQQMKDDGSPESPNITVGGSVYAGVSHGPCN